MQKSERRPENANREHRTGVPAVRAISIAEDRLSRSAVSAMVSTMKVGKSESHAAREPIWSAPAGGVAGGECLFPARSGAPCLGHRCLRPAAAQFPDDHCDDEMDDDAGQLVNRDRAVEVHIPGDAQCGERCGGHADAPTADVEAAEQGDPGRPVQEADRIAGGRVHHDHAAGTRLGNQGGGLPPEQRRRSQDREQEPASGHRPVGRSHRE